MELLTRTMRDLRRLLSPDAWFSYGVVAVLVTLEIIGRRGSDSDVQDALSASIVGLLALLALSRHRQMPLPWVNGLLALAQRVRTFYQKRALDIGVDLRGTPPLPRALPPKIMWSLTGLLLWTSLLLFAADWVPHGFRAVAIHVFYLGCLALVIAVWAALLVCTLIAVVIPTALIHDSFVSRVGNDDFQGARRLEFVCLGAYFGTLLLAASLLPPWVPLLLCLLALVVNLLTIAVPSNPDVSFVWRYRHNDQGVRCIPWGQWVTCEFSILTLATVDLVLLACGSSLVGESGANAQEAMPITTGLGLVLAWLAPGALGALVLQALLGRLRDPARPARPVLHVGGACAPADRKALAQFFGLRGWLTRFAPAASGPLDVRVEIAPGAQPDPEPSWPLQSDCEALRSGDMLQRLLRRDEIQKRRRLIAGLETLFKCAKRHSFKRGSGFWVAPHYWFIPGLSRDTQEDELNLAEGTVLSGIIGPPYHRLLARPVRHHIYQILRALQIDLIFVEDGVGWKRFCRVLRLMFEVFDVFGGRRRAEEVQFHGVPGTRVLIHEFELSEPFRSEVYPEPDYENLGRARILHVFRDRGEQNDRLETPLDFTRMPAPSMAR